MVLALWVGLPNDIVEAITLTPPTFLYVAFELTDIAGSSACVVGIVLATYGVARGAGASHFAACLAAIPSALLPAILTVRSIISSVEQVADRLGA